MTKDNKEIEKLKQEIEERQNKIKEIEISYTYQKFLDKLLEKQAVLTSLNQIVYYLTAEEYNELDEIFESELSENFEEELKELTIKDFASKLQINLNFDWEDDYYICLDFITVDACFSFIENKNVKIEYSKIEKKLKELKESVSQYEKIHKILQDKVYGKQPGEK